MNIFDHPIYKIQSVSIIAPYTIEVIFDNLEKRIINLSDILHGEIYGPLKDKSIFNQVKVDEEVNTIVWPNGADFDPAILYDWENCKEELIELTKSW